MTEKAKPSAADIRHARQENPKMRERDLASQLGITEAELVAAHCGHGVRRVNVDLERLLPGLEAVGEVMALTRNESAVHEKIGVYDKPVIGKHASMMLGAEIDLRLFPKHFVHGFAVEKRDGDEVRRSLQVFDAAGDAVHKVHLRPASDVNAYEALVAGMLADDQEPGIDIAGIEAAEQAGEVADISELRGRWEKMTDVHQFVGILRDLRLTRRRAVELVGQDFARRLGNDAVTDMLHRVAETELPIMCFVGSRGCIQIHSGPITSVKPMGLWINVLDPTFHLHLRTDHISDVWAVKKPNSDGHVTSIEAYDADGNLIIQFFGERQEGTDERAEWRSLVAGLPSLAQSSAA
ncbi:hemin-degrading factor [Nitratireductor mangrovi]|uniref:Hemin-degrading factor n=1 Tax=Nitratireductor mangrovi TaxID=2599600 RepID=A0A5B8L3Z6_9HYPH|nr:ChuX/HutX family heme-like substrate-binding protein [Nitratireductor mangrovi]QDZ02559.1 hemin-degrading factor [Nitratireductor mangrovi]